HEESFLDDLFVQENFVFFVFLRDLRGSVARRVSRLPAASGSAGLQACPTAAGSPEGLRYRKLSGCADARLQPSRYVPEPRRHEVETKSTKNPFWTTSFYKRTSCSSSLFRDLRGSVARRDGRSERAADADVDGAAVHAERRLARERLDAVERIDGAVAVGEHVEQVLRAGGERVAGPVQRDLDVGQPPGAVLLVVGGVEREAAERAVARRGDGRAERAVPPVAADPRVVVRLAALDPPPLDPIEQHRLEPGELRRRRHRTDDLGPRVTVA